MKNRIRTKKRKLPTIEEENGKSTHKSTAKTLVSAILLVLLGFYGHGILVESTLSTDKTSGKIRSALHNESDSDVAIKTENDDSATHQHESPSSSSSNTFSKHLDNLRNAQTRWIETMMYKDYGKEAFRKMFLDDDSVSPSKTFLKLKSFRSVSDSKINEVSTQRLRRKLKIKLLQNHLYQNATFVWVTGGHSAAAGHGNLFNESYTAFLERDLRQIFPSIGLKMEVRNFAMGGSGSGPELGLCVEQIYGRDVDILSWDFGMTDVYSPVRLLLYAIRANLLLNHPPIFAFRVQGENRLDLLRKFQDMSAAAFYLPEATRKLQIEAIPGVTFDNVKEVKNWPPMIRSFKCREGIEKGDLGCDDAKYSLGLCDNRAGKASWHPGFKMHALDGHTTALFVVQELIHATEELAVQLEGYEETAPSATSKSNSKVAKTVPEPIVLLNTLLKEEHKDFEKFQKADLPELAYHLHEWHKCNKKFSEEEKDLEKECASDADFDPLVSTFYKGPGICHTARLPSETRYKGYLVNDVTRVGGPVPAGEETYATGAPINGDIKDDGTFKLVFKQDQRDTSCPVTVSPDYKDFFNVHEKDGWAKLILPNDAEKVAYEYKASEFKGLIGIAFLTCPWNRCPKGFVGTKRDFDQEKFEVTVNGVAATSLMLFHDLGCYFVKGPDGFQWKNRDDTEDYEIAIRILEKGSHVEVSSVILY